MVNKKRTKLVLAYVSIVVAAYRRALNRDQNKIFTCSKLQKGSYEKQFYDSTHGEKIIWYCTPEWTL